MSSRPLQASSLDTKTIVVVVVVTVVGGLVLIAAIALLAVLVRARAAREREEVIHTDRIKVYLTPPPKEKASPAIAAGSARGRMPSFDATTPEPPSSLATASDGDEASLSHITIAAHPYEEEAWSPKITPLHLDREGQAAVTIQRHFRGYMTRRETTARMRLGLMPGQRSGPVTRRSLEYHPEPEVELEAVREAAIFIRSRSPSRSRSGSLDIRVAGHLRAPPARSASLSMAK